MPVNWRAPVPWPFGLITVLVLVSALLFRPGMTTVRVPISLIVVGIMGLALG